eukprot:GHVU01025697.1.p3 GENE.GHVU01025697.1~~GHVU01025697.1.p3  ORF type:complete len:131 (-),score=12.91 GHVU01025697.1:46-438(-)
MVGHLTRARPPIDWLVNKERTYGMMTVSEMADHRVKRSFGCACLVVGRMGETDDMMSSGRTRASPPPPEEVKPKEGGRIHDVGLSSSFVIRHSSSLWSGDQVAFVLVVAVMTNYHLIIKSVRQYSIICPH